MWGLWGTFIRSIILAFVAALTLTLSSGALAQQQPPSPDDREAAIRRAAGELKLQSGVIKLANGKAEVNAEHLSYLSPADAEKLLVQVWGNPRGTGRNSLGALVPRGFDPLTDESWAIIVYYSDDGHVSDAAAAKIDYAELLSEMKEQIRDANPERVHNGGNELDLIGWARPPYYDQASHKLHWAKHIRSIGGDSLNYNVRVLGREGVLELNFIAAMTSLPEIEKAIPVVLTDVNFTDGNRYDQYQAGSDKLAEYGIAALIAGVALKKVGLFGGILVAILAAKKFIIIGAIALFAAFGGFFKRLRRGSRLPPPNPPSST